MKRSTVTWKKEAIFFCVSFADRALAVKDLGSGSFRTENFPKVLLSQVACFHQMMKGLAGCLED